MEYPSAIDESRVGTYSPIARSGGGHVWDAVLEYRVWCLPQQSTHDPEDNTDYYYAFATYQEALAFSEQTATAREPLALVLQKEYIDEPEPGQYLHKRSQRIAEWPVAFLKRPRRTTETIPEFIIANSKQSEQSAQR